MCITVELKLCGVGTSTADAACGFAAGLGSQLADYYRGCTGCSLVWFVRLPFPAASSVQAHLLIYQLC